MKIRLALLSLWLGAMAFFSFVVAPSAFAVLPSPQLAGNLVSRTLGVTEIIGIVLGAVLLILLLVARRPGRKAFLFELITVALMTVSMIVSHFFVSQRLHAMRAEFGDISALAATDQVRLAFNQLHQYSVWLMSFDILAALVLIVILLRRSSAVHANA
ncbi:MAG TPA: DUF4149 domain-containing protein [Blastocatellia bacterium]|nr:DUF4149 domain-containing protein [Blastocatellia bacterium]